MLIGSSIDITNVRPAGGLGPPPALGFDAQSQGIATSSASFSTPHTVGAVTPYGLLRVTVAFLDPAAGIPTITGVTYAGLTMTFIPGTLKAATLGAVASYYLTAPPPGTANIVVTLDTPCNLVVCGDSWDGVSRLTPFGTAQVNNSIGTAVTVPAVTVAVGNVLLASLVISTTTATTNATAGGNLQNLGNSLGGASPSRVRGVAANNNLDSGSVVAAWTLAASKAWAATAVELKAA